MKRQPSHFIFHEKRHEENSTLNATQSSSGDRKSPLALFTRNLPSTHMNQTGKKSHPARSISLLLHCTFAVLIGAAVLGVVDLAYALPVSERTVRLFYFLPNDRPYRQEVVDDMKTGIVELQTFFAEQMEAHGHGRKTFQFETDDQGDPIVHRVDGDYNDSHYSRTGNTEREISRAFDNSANVVFIVMDVSSSPITGQGTGNKSGGWLIIYRDWNWSFAAHELGHAFGLKHDFRDDAYILSYGLPNRSSAKLSACAAEFLSVHPYFNANISLENESPPTVELISSSGYPPGLESVPGPPKSSR